MMTYVIIFLSKIFENALSTLRLIVVASGKKIFGAILLLCTTLIWLSITGIVIMDINKDPLKIIFFALGSLVGSYLGSILEEKIALGDNLVAYKTIDNYIFDEILINYNINYTKVNTNIKNEIIYIIIIPRRHKNHILNIIKEYDSKAIILSEIININYLDK